MNVYIVHNSEKLGEDILDDKIIGVYTDELDAYKTACATCATQIQNDHVTTWLEKHTLPSEDDDLVTWKKYLLACNAILKDLDVIHVTTRQLDKMPIYQALFSSMKQHM
jgi:hypothetical protein